MKIGKYSLAAAALLTTTGATTAFAGAFGAGDLAVLQVGDGSIAITNAAMSIFVDEFTTAGSQVQSIAMPTVASGGNFALTVAGSATTEGLISRSADGQTLEIGGYNAAPLTPTPNASTAAVVNRVVGVVSANGTVDTTTAISSGTSGNFRGVTSDNGTRFWASSSTANVGYIASLGASTALQLNLSGGSGPSTVRYVKVYNGQLYQTTSSGSFQGIASIGGGLPTTAAQVTTALPGFPTASGPSPYGFVMADLNSDSILDVAYVADDRTTALGGIQKWTFNGSAWSLSYTLATGIANFGARGLTVDFSGANPVIYATTAETSANHIISIIDTGSGSTASTIATAAANTVFRGIDFTPVAAPEPSTLALAGLGGIAAVVGLLRRRK